MLTKVTAYNPATNLDPLVFNIINRPDTDLFEVRNIDGLGAVKADVNTTQMGSINKETFSGSSSGKRNIVLTLGLDPDWDNWTVSRLRRLLDQYFMPHFQTRLVFESMEFSPVEIFGYIESNEPNMFTKDPEQQVSIICPDPDFTSVDLMVMEGYTSGDAVDIDYAGNIATGFNLRVNKVAATPDPTWTNVLVGDPTTAKFWVDEGATDAHYLEINTVPGEKYVDTVVVPGDVHTKRLDKLTDDSKWPLLGPGTTRFEVNSSGGDQFWYLTYYNKFGSL